MKIMARVELDAAVPDRVLDIVAAIPGLTVRRSHASLLRVDDESYPLLVFLGVAPYAHAMALALVELAGPNRLAFVVAERLLPNVRGPLEQAGCLYADGAGSVHLQAPRFLLHREKESARISTTVPAPRGLGAIGVRVVQQLLEDPEREWAVVDLAHAAGASTGQSHNVLKRLEQEGFLQDRWSGQQRRRQVSNPTDLLDWLARVPAARRVHRQLKTYRYAADPTSLVTRLAHDSTKADVPWALTGAAAARVMGASVVTALPVIMVRVPADLDLLQLAGVLGLEAVDVGANVQLIADVGEVGLHGSRRNGPVSLAPAARIWLDMLSEPRGDDAAALFREAVLGY